MDTVTKNIKAVLFGVNVKINIYHNKPELTQEDLTNLNTLLKVKIDLMSAITRIQSLAYLNVMEGVQNEGLQLS